MPHIAVVVPVLDEAGEVPPFLAGLAAQREVRLEVVLCDGGSRDDTVAAAEAAAWRAGLSLNVVRSGAGRGRQLNAGAATACAPYLLLLHVDSRFSDPFALRDGVAALRGAGREAGRFGLRFDRSRPGHDLGYYYHECKARLDRPGCVHGDQGLLLTRDLFLRAGPLPESAPMLAETRFAAAVRQRAGWQLLPAELHTSARRFETEGPGRRRTLNAVIMDLDAAGQEELLAALPGLYRTGTAEGDGYGAVMAGVAAGVDALPPAQRRAFWAATGAYVRDNAWQIAYFLDVRRAFRRGLPPGGEERRALELFDRLLAPHLAGEPARRAAEWLTRGWFRRAVRRAARGGG